MQLTIEQLKTASVFKPEREGQRLRCAMLPPPTVRATVPDVLETEDQTFVFIAKQFDTPTLGPHLRWTIQCEVII